MGQRLLTLTSAIWHNRATGAPIARTGKNPRTLTTGPPRPQVRRVRNRERSRAARGGRVHRLGRRPTTMNAGSHTRLNRSSNRRDGSSLAHWCSLTWIFSTRHHAVSASGNCAGADAVGVGAAVFTTDLLTFQPQRCGHAAALGHVTGFPGLGLLRRLRPTPGSSIDGGSARHRPGWPVGRAIPGWFPRSPHDRWTGSVPSSSPAASPRLRRRPSPWPPNRPTRGPTRSHPVRRRDRRPD